MARFSIRHTVVGTALLAAFVGSLPLADSAADELRKRSRQKSHVSPSNLAQTKSDQSQSRLPREAAGEVDEVLCVAGCGGKPPLPVFRRLREDAPEMPKPQQSNWRRVANNMWCHEHYGCRSYDVLRLHRAQPSVAVIFRLGR